ncbi:MAG: lactate utilization protein [Bacteroidales bacterium]|nr:lactate utilization protein [Bacteroidales bacterium]
MSKSISEKNRDLILGDLASVEKNPQYDTYEKLVSTKDYFVQPEGDLCEVYCEKLKIVAGKPEVVESVDAAIVRIKEIIGEEVLLCNNKDLLQILEKNSIPYNTDSEYARVAKFSLTTCEALAARTGSIFVSSAQIEGRRLISAAETHIVLAYANQICPDLAECIDVIEGKYGNKFPSQVTAITGPSRTSDIEKTLVLGAHGPKNLYVLIVK